MFQNTSIALNKYPTTTQQRLACAVRNCRLLPDGFCCLNYTSSNILFRIIWPWVNQGFHVEFLWRFSTATMTIFGEEQTLTLRCSLTPKTFCRQSFGGNCSWLLIGCYLLLTRLSARICWVFLEKMLPELLEVILSELRRNTGLSKKMDGIWNRYNLKSTGRIYTFGILKCSEKFKVLDLP